MYSYYDEIDSNDEILILLKEFYNNFMNELKQSIQSLQSNEPKTTGEKVHKFIAEGINTIKQGVNNINMNKIKLKIIIIKNLIQKKIKMKIILIQI